MLKVYVVISVVLFFFSNFQGKNSLDGNFAGSEKTSNTVSDDGMYPGKMIKQGLGRGGRYFVSGDVIYNVREQGVLLE